MTFVDECTVFARAGRGGNGSASLHSEPFKPRGGPDGGDGGDGGSVVFEVSRGVHDLSWLADHPHVKADGGDPGRKAKRDGATGRDVVVPVPDGTVVFDEQGLVADLVGEGARERGRPGRPGRTGERRLRQCPQPRAADGRAGRGRRGEAPPRRAAHGRRRRARRAAERRQVDAARAAHRREAEDRELPVHHAHAEPRRRRRRRRSVRRGRHPRVDRGCERGQGPGAPLPAARRALPRPRARGRPRRRGPGGRSRAPSETSSPPTTPSSPNGRRSWWVRRRTSSTTPPPPRPGSRTGAMPISAMTGEGVEDLLGRLGLLAREAEEAQPERQAVRGAPSGPASIHRRARSRRPLARDGAIGGALGARGRPRRRGRRRDARGAAQEGRRRAQARVARGPPRGRGRDPRPGLRVPARRSVPGGEADAEVAE